MKKKSENLAKSVHLVAVILKTSGNDHISDKDLSLSSEQESGSSRSFRLGPCVKSTIYSAWEDTCTGIDPISSKPYCCQ